MPPLSTDEPLREAVRRLRAGPADECYATLDACLRPRLLAYFRADSATRGEADDLVQMTLARVLQGVGRLRAEESFLAWLFTIARNVRLSVLDARRREQKVLVVGLEAADAAADPRPSALETEIEGQRLAALEAAIERLPRQQRQCLVLRVRTELSYEEVAATLDLSVRTVRNHLALARRTLRLALGGGLGEGEDA
jgi:RNA polymerase sigma-70 factor (ECF subfamily)